MCVNRCIDRITLLCCRSCVVVYVPIIRLPLYYFDFCHSKIGQSVLYKTKHAYIHIIYNAWYLNDFCFRFDEFWYQLICKQRRKRLSHTGRTMITASNGNNNNKLKPKTINYNAISQHIKCLYGVSATSYLYMYCKGMRVCV